jgi:hypothetical protein
VPSRVLTSSRQTYRFEHALVSLDDGRRLSAAESPPLHNSREPIGFYPNLGQAQYHLPSARAAFPGLRHRVMSDGEQWADVDLGSGYESEHDRIEPEMRRSDSAGEMGARTGCSAPPGRPCLTINGQRIFGREDVDQGSGAFRTYTVLSGMRVMG